MAYPVLLIHGMWCTHRALDRIVELMAPRGYDCHAPSLPAHEPVPDQPLQVGARGIMEYVAFLEDYVRKQGFDRPPILIGHSMGGFLAQALAARIETLAVVLLTPAVPAGINGLRLSNLLTFAPHFLRWGFWRKGYKPTAAAVRRAAYNGLPAEQQQRLYEGLVHESGRAITELGMWWADFGRAARVESARVKCPVYIVSGGNDRLTPPAVVRKVAALYPQAWVRHYANRCHWVVDDEETEEMVHSFCGWLRPFELKLERQKADRPAQQPLLQARRVGG
ncbi:MAG TPA: alpha/beta fold hydrolase [Solimonas sp.]|nr:alpha/beta fold hydrolase [Solimonas sp.]